MKPREVPGALALGLLASLLAHALSFGGGHVAGGAYHFALESVALAASASFAVILGSVAWAHAGSVGDGSILAARLALRLPRLGPIALAASGWFVLMEAIEGAHAPAPSLAIGIALVLSAWLMRSGARALLRALARLVVAIRKTTFATRTPFRRASRPRTIALHPSPLLRRRFARPPPVMLGA